MNLSTGVFSRSPRVLAVTVALGFASVGLFLLFLFSGTLVELAAAARRGEPLAALVPLVVAMTFSLVHGAFIGHFWDLLGLRAKK